MPKRTAPPAPPSCALAPTESQAVARVALAAARAGGPGLFADLLRELAAGLDVPLVLLAVFAEDACSTLHTLAVHLDGQPDAAIDIPTGGLPGIDVHARGFQCVAAGVAARLPADCALAAAGMDAAAAVPLCDGAGEPLGLLAALDRRPLPASRAAALEAMLTIGAARAAAEIERQRSDETLRWWRWRSPPRAAARCSTNWSAC